jgi:single-strand DNA-binding protein
LINRVVLIGRLVKDPELRYTPSGVATCSFTIAVNRQFSNSQGEKEADFIQIVAWRQLAELCANYLKKGSQAGLEGRLQTRSYDNKEGKRVFVVEVVADNVQFLDGNKSENKQSNQSQDPFANDSRTIDIADDDLPF